jgi:hypothetical protein
MKGGSEINKEKEPEEFLKKENDKKRKRKRRGKSRKLEEREKRKEKTTKKQNYGDKERGIREENKA